MRPSIIITALASLTYAACGQDRSDCVTYDVTADITETSAPPSADAKKPTAKAEPAATLNESKANKGSEPYNLGRTHARKLHTECHTTDEVRDELLDINARITNIRCRIGEEAANDYMCGMKEYLTEAGDTLASTLF